MIYQCHAFSGDSETERHLENDMDSCIPAEAAASSYIAGLGCTTAQFLLHSYVLHVLFT
jgi:hypothetical protein